MVIGVLALVLAARGLIGWDGGSRQAALLAVAIAMVPASAGALAGDRHSEDRVEILTMGLVPGAAAVVAVSTFPQLTPLALLMVGVIAWRLVPARLASRLPIGAGLVIGAIGLYLMSTLGVDSSYAGGVLPALVVTAFGLATAFVPVMGLATGDADGFAERAADADHATGRQLQTPAGQLAAYLIDIDDCGTMNA